MGKKSNGALVPRCGVWSFATRILGLSAADSKVQFTPFQCSLMKSYDRAVGMTAEEGEAYQAGTGLEPWVEGTDPKPFQCWCLTRGGGKSLILSIIALYECLVHEYTAQTGETVATSIVSPRMKQSALIVSYIKGFLGNPALKGFVASTSGGEVTFTNGRVIRTVAVDKHGGGGRGTTNICIILDECAFLTSDGLQVAEDQWAAQLAGCRGVENPRGIISSSANGAGGLFFETFSENHGKSDSAWETFLGPVDLARPDMSPALLREYQRADENAYRREFLCDFSAGSGTEKFFNSNLVEQCIDVGTIEIPPGGPTAEYRCGVDPSGGSNDCFTVCIVERLEDGSVRQCLARSWDPKEQTFSVHDIAREISELVAPFALRTVFGDIFGGQWVAEAFTAVGLEYQVRGFNAQNKLQRASCLRELFATGRIRLLDIAQQTKELCEYEKKTLPSGQVSVNHPNTKDGSDDYLDSLGLAVWELVGHVPELHAPESLLVWKKFEDGFTEKRYPQRFGLPSTGQVSISESEIAAKGENSSWLLRNCMKDWRFATCSITELAGLMGILTKHLMAHLGRDLVLQHQWMRWLLAGHRRDSHYRGGELGFCCGSPPESNLVDLEFPGIPAFAKLFEKIFNNGMDSRKFIKFGRANEPKEFRKACHYVSWPTSWPSDLLGFPSVPFVRGGDEPVSRVAACPPWAPPNPSWQMTRPGHPLHRQLSYWQKQPWAERIENIFRVAREEQIKKQEAQERVSRIRADNKAAAARDGKNEDQTKNNDTVHIFGSGY